MVICALLQAASEKRLPFLSAFFRDYSRTLFLKISL